MVIESRKWRLLVQAFVLIITGALIIGFAGSAIYALQTPEPAPILSAAQLVGGAYDGRYATVEGVPDPARSVTVRQGDVTTYWVRLVEYGDGLYVTTTDSAWQVATGDRVRRFTGKLGRLTSAADYAEFKRVSGLPPPGPDEEVYVLVEGEQPNAYRPMLPVVGGLLIVWGLVFWGFVRAWRHRGPRRDSVEAAKPLS
jgi:hypothetical protein